jgi:hypothetical protein
VNVGFCGCQGAAFRGAAWAGSIIRQQGSLLSGPLLSPLQLVDLGL